MRGLTPGWTTQAGVRTIPKTSGRVSGGEEVLVQNNPLKNRDFVFKEAFLPYQPITPDIDNSLDVPGAVLGSDS